MPELEMLQWDDRKEEVLALLRDNPDKAYDEASIVSELDDEDNIVGITPNYSEKLGELDGIWTRYDLTPRGYFTWGDEEPEELETTPQNDDPPESWNELYETRDEVADIMHEGL